MTSSAFPSLQTAFAKLPVSQKENVDTFRIAEALPWRKRASAR